MGAQARGRPRLFSVLCDAGVAAPAGVDGGRESVVDLRKGSQGALRWEVEGERDEANPREVFAPFLEVSLFRLASPVTVVADDRKPRSAPASGSLFRFAAQLGWWDLLVQPQGPVIYCCEQGNLGVIVPGIFRRPVFDPYCFRRYSLRSVHLQLLFG